ncbi:MAG: hypothetical protein M0Z52_13845 [Actinomycetota bacterium]|nr:hypothetical protein [Nitrospiraceae bacterium]MDA8157513.1 hypothetical protein [Actinomycetota bacterium]
MSGAALPEGAALDPHMEDQIALYLALTEKGESSFTTSWVTEHLLSNLWVISRFIGVSCRVKGEKGKLGLVEMMTV